MKKVIAIATALFLGISSTLFAQELTSKKGFTILPEAGDYVLGFNAVPVLNFALNTVNIMNNTGQTAAHPGFVTGMNNVIVGKYYMSEDMAARVRVGITTTKNSTKTF